MRIPDVEIGSTRLGGAREAHTDANGYTILTKPYVVYIIV